MPPSIQVKKNDFPILIDILEEEEPKPIQAVPCHPVRDFNNTDLKRLAWIVASMIFVSFFYYCYTAAGSFENMSFKLLDALYIICSSLWTCILKFFSFLDF